MTASTGTMAAGYTLLMPRAVLTSDTTQEAEQVQVKIWRSMSPLQKAQLTSAVTQGATDLALAGLRSRHPGASSRELRIRLALMTLGDGLVRRIYSDAARFIGP